MDANQIHLIKIILLGSTLSGKTSIIQRMENNIFDKTIKTTNGAQYIMKSYYYFNKNWKLNIWDAPGNIKYRNLNKIFIKMLKFVYLFLI